MVEVPGAIIIISIIITIITIITIIIITVAILIITTSVTSQEEEKEATEAAEDFIVVPTIIFIPTTTAGNSVIQLEVEERIMRTEEEGEVLMRVQE